MEYIRLRSTRRNLLVYPGPASGAATARAAGCNAPSRFRDCGSTREISVDGADTKRLARGSPLEMMRFPITRHSPRPAAYARQSP